MTFNGKNSQPRKSSTNSRVLSARVGHLEQNNTTKVTYRALRGNPPPVSNNFKTVKRTVQVSMAAPSSGVTQLTTGAISSALTGVTGDFQVSRLDFYSLAGYNTGSVPSATFTCEQANLLLNNSSLGLLQTVSVTDYGTATSMPGVSFFIPRGRGVWITKDTAGSAILGSSTTAAVVIVHVMQQLAA